MSGELGSGITKVQFNVQHDVGGFRLQDTIGTAGGVADRRG